MYELTIPENHEIQLRDRKVEIIGYSELLTELEKLGEYLLSVEVTEENIKENKQLVADCRKIYTNLNEQKIAFKKEYVKPLETLEAQVKEIGRRLTNYENNVRSQVRKLEDNQRAEKLEEIKELYNKRLKIYGGKNVEELYPFDDFIKKEYLNKKTTFKKIEEEMVDFFENRRDDVSALVVFADKADLNRNSVVAEYLNRGSVSETITYFETKKEEKESVKQALESNKVRPTEEPKENYLYLKIKESDYARVSELFKLGQIDFELIDLE